MKQNGSISLLVLIFGVVFTVTIGALALFGAVQHQGVRRNAALQQSLNLAESGVNYYRWHLSHDPTDYTDGTQSAGPYTHTVDDAIVPGQFSLTITPPPPGSSTITVVSTGTTNQYPDITRTITAQFGPRSLASFAFLHNSNIWFGQGTTIYGDVLVNGGIRMDGTNTGTLSSEKTTYTCGIETGCYPDTEEKPGIWGNGGPKELWKFPAEKVDFDTISADFTGMKEKAVSTQSYLAPSGQQGYHLVFASNGSVAVSKVTGTDYKKGYSDENGCEKLYQTIVTEQTVATYQLASTPVIFAEDTVWVEGVVKGKTTVVAARLPLDNYNHTIWINNNLTYVTKDGTTHLGLIAQKDIIIPLSVPTTLEIDGALLAHRGRVIRHHYRKTNGPHCSSYNEATRNELIIYGSIISNQRSYWNFSSPGTNSPSSGFVKRTITYDSHLLYDAPPYFPTSGIVDLISWNED